MDEPRSICVVEDPRFMDHVAPSGHPEHEQRLVAVSQAIAEFSRGESGQIQRLDPRRAEDREILRIHDDRHLQMTEIAAKRAPGNLDPDTYVSRQSFDVAMLAAGSAVELALGVARGDLASGFAASRPPGHHAEGDRAMGFCLFNNVAIAARALQAEAGLERIAIVDWDVHHGNGTQHSFEDDPSILFVSAHQFPFYPGTGAVGEVGSGRGEGSTLNVPLPPGCGDLEYVGIFHHVVAPVIREFRPEMILISCGFDAHQDDPLASMSVGAGGYLTMTRIMRALAKEVCGGRICFFLEGGYSPTGLGEGTGSVLSAMLEPGSWQPAPGDVPDLVPGGSLHQAVSQVAAVHGQRYRSITST